MLSRKHYQAIAEAIRDLPAGRQHGTIYKDELVDALSAVFKVDNPCFNPTTFWDAAMKKKP